MADDPNAWAPTEKGRAQAQAHLDDIARIHTLYPKCSLCGQHAIQLDKFGLCSKISDSHKTWRGEARTETKRKTR